MTVGVVLFSGTLRPFNQFPSGERAARSAVSSRLKETEAILLRFEEMQMKSLLYFVLLLSSLGG